MPRNQFQRMVFAFLTVLVTVHGYVFYSAYFFECVIGSPLSFKMACKMFDPRKNHPMIFETVIISCTVLIMCPLMSFLAAWMYLSILYRIQYLHAFCKCNKVNMFKFPLCFLLTNIFHPTYCEMGIWKTFCKGHCCPKLAGISGTSAE